MFIVIVGGGKVGWYLGRMLKEQSGYDVTIVEMRREQAQRIKEETPELNVVIGDGDEPYVLDEAGLARADAVVAATGHDEDNLVVCLLGKYEYEVPHTIARINNPNNEWLFKDQFGVDIALSNTHMIAKILQEEVALGDIVTLLKLRKGDLSLVELTLSEDCGAVGQEVSKITLPPDTVLVSIIRGNDVLIPHGPTVLEAGDEILAVTSPEHEGQLAQCLGTTK